METISFYNDNAITVCSGAQFPAVWENVKRRIDSCKDSVHTLVREIINNVRLYGDKSVREYTIRFDHVQLQTWCLGSDALEQAYAHVNKENPALIAALEQAAGTIRRFAEVQYAQLEDVRLTVTPGVTVGQRVIPVGRAGIYVPGGRYPLVSTVLMGVIPAKVAGVRTVVLATPPGFGCVPSEAILAAAKLAGVDAVYVMGGAQAIAALAYGTESVPRVDVIAGPGNSYVAEAKRQVFGDVGIDLIAGPTDVLIAADNEALRGINSRLIAFDMLAQAEHDPLAAVRVLLPDMETARAVCCELGNACSTYQGNLDTALESLTRNGLMVLYESLEEAVHIANTIAPEHLELFGTKMEVQSSQFINYGSMFIGTHSGEVLGDYAAGVNHTLPTLGSARFSSGLSVHAFIKKVTTVQCKPGAGLNSLLETSMTIAEAEGLFWHKQSAQARLGRN